MSKQSSVQWLFQQLWDTPKDKFEWQSIFEQAKAMHKEEIIKAVSKGWDYNEEGRVSWMGEQYYKETFGGQDERDTSIPE